MLRRVSTFYLCAVLLLGSVGLSASADQEDCTETEVWNEETQQCEPSEHEQERTVTGSWTECRDDGREYKVTEYDNGTRDERDIGACKQDSEARVIESWCEDGDRIEEWEDASGNRWQDRYHDPGCENDQQGYEDPYGCQDGAWWDHYLARCITEEHQRLLDGFWNCLDEAERALAEEWKRHDIRAREQRQERRALEEEAMAHERAGRWDEAQRIWDDLRRAEWEEQRKFHRLEQQSAQAVDDCIDEFSEKARSLGADYLIEEFRMHERHTGPAPRQEGGFEGPRPHEGEWDCAPPPGEFPDDPYTTYRDDRHEARDDDAYRQYPDDRHEGPNDEAHRQYPGESHQDPYASGEPRCPEEDHRGGPPMDAGFGLPPEAQAAIKEVIAWCEERMWEIDSKRFEADSYDQARGLEQEVRDLERECREKMEAIYREHGRGHGDEFDEHFGSFTMTESGDQIEVVGANLLFTGDPEKSRISGFSCQGVPVLDTVSPYFRIEDVLPTATHKLAFFDHRVSGGMPGDPERMGAYEKDAFMVVHDDPRCTIGVKPVKAQSVEEAEVKLVFSSLYTCAQREANLLCTDGEGTDISVRVHGEAPRLVDERTLIVRDHVVIRRTGGDDGAFEAYDRHEHFDASAAVSFKEDGLVAQAVTVGDLELSVAQSDDARGIKVSMDKASHTGSFVVLSLDGLDRCELEVGGWAVTDQQRQRLEVQKARNLADALNADYDGDHAKYYAVQDEHGCQLIITNSHYSVKEFVVHEVEGGVFSKVPGFSVALVSAGLLGVATVLRGRRTGGTK